MYFLKIGLKKLKTVMLVDLSRFFFLRYKKKKKNFFCGKANTESIFNQGKLNWKQTHLNRHKNDFIMCFCFCYKGHKIRLCNLQNVNSFEELTIRFMDRVRKLEVFFDTIKYLKPQVNDSWTWAWFRGMKDGW